MPYKDESEILLKLENGYNIGLSKDSISDFEIIEEIEEQPENKKADEKTNNDYDVSVIGCGGTISSRVDYSTGAVIPELNSSQIAQNFGNIDELKGIKTKELFKLFSEDFNTMHWKETAKAIYEELKSGKSVVVAHGTDTMHYTASAIAFSIQQMNAPVIFTGSQRSSDRPSSDAKENFLNALFSARQDFGEVVIGMHSNVDENKMHLHRAVKARKMHTSRRDAFKSINIQPLALVDYKSKNFEKIEKQYPIKEKQKLSKLENDFSDKVAMLYIFPGIKPEFIEKFSDYDAIVFAGTGLGHAPVGGSADSKTISIYEKLISLRERGIILAMSSQTIFGRINMNVYSTGRKLLELDVIGNLCDMTPDTMFVKLSWVMGKKRKYQEIKELMEKNLVGEIAERSIYYGDF